MLGCHRKLEISPEKKRTEFCSPLRMRSLHKDVQRFCFFRPSWILLLMLSTFFFKTLGSQAEQVHDLSWRGNGATVGTNNIHNRERIQDLEPEPSMQDMHRNYIGGVHAHNCKCYPSSFDKTFLQLLMLVCLPQSESTLEGGGSKSRSRVITDDPCMSAEYGPFHLKNKSMPPENVSDHLLMPSENEPVHGIVSDDGGFHDGKPELPVDEVQADSVNLGSGNVYSKGDWGVAGGDVIKTRPILNSNLSNIEARREHGDGLYNYAAESKGAKVLASNKESKGASNILNGDKDKYLRTPCTADNKYVDLELSEETLIISVAIANHEFYSSNVRQFELWGSLVYPTDEWDFLGTFDAENIRTMQIFKLQKPKWVRYLRIRMLSHYGSDFYCTLSVLEVYGVDAIEWLLVDWIAEETGKGVRFSAPVGDTAKALSQDIGTERNSDQNDDLLDETYGIENYNHKNANKPDTVQSTYYQTSKPALDAVKLLMQKVRSLEQNHPLISHYIQELNDRYEAALKSLDQELVVMNSRFDATASELSNLRTSVDNVKRRLTHDKRVLQSELVNQLKRWNSDMEFLRNRLESTEAKGMVALAVALLSTISVIGMQLIGFCMHLLRMFPEGKRENPCSGTLWMVPFFSCVIVICVLSL